MTPSLDRPSRDAAHVLLDAVTAYDPYAGEQASTAAANLALQRLNAVDAVTATLGENGDLQLNIDRLANATVYVIYLLAAQLANVTNVDTDTVIAAAREIVDNGP